MGGVNSIQKINYEDIQYFISNSSFVNNNSYLIINTLSHYKQDCLIKNTINCKEEESIINNLLTKNKNIYILLYY